MTNADPTREFARYHRPDRFPGLELLTAHYRCFAFTPHVHEGYGIALLESGAERFRYRGAEHVAIPGDLALLNPDEVHTGSRATESGWSYRAFFLSPNLLLGLAEALGQRGTPFFPEVIVHDATLARPLHALHAALTGPASLLEQESRWCDAMGRLVSRFARGGVAHDGAQDGGDAVARVRVLLRERVEENVGLSELAEEAGLSAWHLNRMFRRRYGLPPHAYQLQLRLARARLLLQSPGSIASIAGRLGFADQAHLSRLFKRTFGVTPVAYRSLA